MKRAWVLSVVCAVAWGCAATRVTGSWTDPSYAQAERPQRALVVAAFPTESSSRTLETKLAGELSQTGVTAVPGSRLLEAAKVGRPAGGAPMDQAALAEVAREHGFDTVVVTRYVGTDVRPGYTGAVYPYSPHYDYRWSATGWYPSWQTEATVETTLMDVDDDRGVVWTASTATDTTRGTSRQFDDLAERVVERMKKDAVL